MKIEDVLKKNNELLKEAVKSAKITKARLEQELINNYSDELFNKIAYLNNEIDKATRLIDAPASYGHKIYAENHPENVDRNGNINEKGIKRFEFLRKRFGFSRFFK
jgi:hypothetical protein